MGAVASAFDNAVVESFFGSMQIELLDRRRWSTRAELAAAVFEWIEAFYNPTRRHSALGYLTPTEWTTSTQGASAHRIHASQRCDGALWVSDSRGRDRRYLGPGPALPSPATRN